MSIKESKEYSVVGFALLLGAGHLSYDHIGLMRAMAKMTAHIEGPAVGYFNSASVKLHARLDVYRSWARG